MGCEQTKGRRLPHYTTYGGTRYACDPKYKQGPEFMTQFRDNFVERAVKQLTKWGCECNKECKCICDVDQYKTDRCGDKFDTSALMPAYLKACGGNRRLASNETLLV